MKKIFLVLFILTGLHARSNDLIIENPYSAYFKKAYFLNPTVPKGILEAVAYTQTRFQHIEEGAEKSCIGYPQTYGVMGLILDGKNYFRNNLLNISNLSGYTYESIINSPEASILAYAKAFSQLQSQRRIYSSDLAAYIPILIDLSEIPVKEDLQNNFALNAHLYQLYWFLSNSQFQDVYEFPDHRIDLQKIFGDNYEVLSSRTITVTDNDVFNQNGQNYQFNNNINIVSPDYPTALYTSAAACNYSSRNGTGISAVTIHFVQGTYAGCISWFQNCAANASAHYVLRSSDGQVTQMVLESAKAWHVGSENPYTVGLEHEGYVNNISWFTNAMYNSSGALTKDICNDNNINKLRTYYGASCSGSSAQCLQGACVKVKGHQMYPNQSHTDPGPNWNWSKFYKIINDTYSITATYTALTGSFYDTGGAGSNYQNDERKFWLFTNPGATNITLSFTSFSLESVYDNLFIYNGGSINSPLIGQYTGTVNPGPVTSVNDSLLVEFRSDCGTTAPGWAANYVMNVTVAPMPGDNIAPTTVVSTENAWKTAAFTSTITDLDNIGGSGIQKGFYQVIDFNGTEWRANPLSGFLADNFDNAIHPEWTVKTGSWSVNGNALVQTDEASPAAGNTNIYAALTQSLSNTYLYHFLAKFEGSGVNRRAGFHFFCDRPDSSNRYNSYFVWFRLDDQKIQIYKVENNLFGSPKVDLPLTFSANQWYDIKTTYDRITGVIKVYLNNNQIASWTDASPYSNGSHVSFRSGNCKFSVDEIKVYRSRNASVSINIGNGNANDIRYQNPDPLTFAGKVKSICQDAAGNLSSIYYHDLNIDWTPPSDIITINDGKANDIEVVITKDSLSCNWGTSTDPNSALAGYWYSIGTFPGYTNTLGWTYNWGSNSVTAKNLNLNHNSTYYFNVKSENGAGLFCNTIVSNGQKVDTNTAAVSIKENINEIGLSVYPNPFTDRITIKLNHAFEQKINIGLTDLLGRELKSTEIKDRSNGYYFMDLKELELTNGTYFLKVKVDSKSYYYKLIKE